jgi:aryl-alcohol dehydrogenase-like predicted oxidoreductase
MKRRDFITKGAAGALTLGIAGNVLAAEKVNITKSALNWEEFSFEPTVPKPSGTIPTGELGKTGIKLSKFGFGSHMRADVVKYTEERQRIIRAAYDLGVTLFDIYDEEQKCYQYEPMGKYLEPFNKNVTISIAFLPYEKRTFEQEFERDLRVLKRDYIDMVRLHAYDQKHPQWDQWEKLFKLKEKGHVRAIGIPIHNMSDLEQPLKNYPLDYVLFPYNFYHNVGWHDVKKPQWDNFDPLPVMLRKKGIGVMTMKAFAGDFLVGPFRKIARASAKYKDVNFNQAALRYVINSQLKPDTTVTGMYNMDHLYTNVGAYYQPKMTGEERALLKEVRDAARMTAKAYLLKHYRFLDTWASAESDLDACKEG